MGKLAVGFGVLLCLTSCHGLPVAETPGLAEGRPLPLRRVRLFENGVGYFERAGKLTEERAVLPVPASHVDDALKTLVVLSDAEAKLSGVEFASVVSGGTARALAGLGLKDETPLGFEDVLKSLEGYRVELVTNDGIAFTGRLVDVKEVRHREPPTKEPTETADPPENGAPEPAPALQPMTELSLFVVGDDGTLRRFETAKLKAVVPLDPGFSARLQTAADALSGRSAQLARNLRVLASGDGILRLGYVAETPVWRATYRLVLDEAADAALLQGWALVHNDTDEPWSQVSVELVNGKPDSFLFPITAPRYQRRPLATPDERLSTVPQLALATPDALWGDNAEEQPSDGSEEVTQGFGSGYGRLGGSHSSRGASGGLRAAGPSDAIRIGDLASVVAAVGNQEGMLFSYRLAEPISLRAHGSALLPFFARSLSAKRLTRFESAASPGRAAVRLVNGSAHTLPAGPLAIFEPQGFSGEAVLGRLRPAGRIFLEYGVDADVELSETVVSEARASQSVAVDAHALEDHYVRTRELKLTLHNRSQSVRTVAYVLTGVVRNAKVTGADSLDYDEHVESALALFDVPAGTRREGKLVIIEALADRVPLLGVSLEDLIRILKSPALNASVRAALTAALGPARTLSGENERYRQLSRDLQTLDVDLSRHREHLKAASEGGGDASPLARRVVELETQRARLHAEQNQSHRRIETLRKLLANELQRVASTD